MRAKPHRKSRCAFQKISETFGAHRSMRGRSAWWDHWRGEPTHGSTGFRSARFTEAQHHRLDQVEVQTPPCRTDSPPRQGEQAPGEVGQTADRKSTRLNSSHV